MAIPQDHGAERLMPLVDQPPQCAMVGLVERLDPSQRLVDIEPLAIDLLAVANHARNGAETPRPPPRTGIGEPWQPPGEHPPIELIGLAVDVDKRARKI